MSQTEAPPEPETAIPRDPLVHKSYSVPVAIAMFAVVAAAVLVVADEMYLRRPYKGIQGQYREAYTDYLTRVAAKRRALVKDVVFKVAELKALEDRATEAKKASALAVAKADAALKTATNQGRALVLKAKMAKSEIAALSYEAEHKAHAEGFAKVEDSPAAKPLLDKIARIEATEITYSWSALSVADEADENGNSKTASREESETATVKVLLAKALEIEATKAKLQTELGNANKPEAEAAKAVEQWKTKNLADVSYAAANATDEDRKKIAELGTARFLDEVVVPLAPETLDSMKAGVDAKYPPGFLAGALRGEINQIHIAEAGNWVDRCMTCHLNVREPMPITAESLRHVLGSAVEVPGVAEDGSPTTVTLPAWPKEKLDATPLELLASHPNPELLKKHDPDRFGCSMCHNGNGVAITNVHLAHGENHHWLQPLYPKENIEAGCVQCHQKDLVLPMGERISDGKDTFRRAGCWGCHRYEGFDTERDRITALEGRRKELKESREAKEQRILNLQALVGTLGEDQAALDKESAASKREQIAIGQEIAGLATESVQLGKRLRALYVERQRVGPNLKDVRVKLLPEFITEWIRNPREAHKDAAGNAFRPHTKMPAFRWWDNPDEEVKDVAAFLWQNANDPAAIAEYRLPAFAPGDAKKGEELFNTKGCLICHSMGTGTARVGHDYAANLSNLGEKNRPEYVARWITDPRRRIAAYDPSKPAGERDVSGAAADDVNVVWTQHAIMPNFRLSETEVRDITTYLTSQKRADVKYDKAPWLEEKDRFDRGRKLVVFQGCAGCHEIKGLEDEKGIGTELTKEGSKPRDQLDFGHHTISAERGVEPLKGTTALLEDAATLFEKDSEWYRPRGFFLHKIAKPDFYDESKFIPDRFNRLRMPQFRFTAREVLDVTSFVLGSVDTKIPESFRYNPGDAGKAIREGWWVVKKYNCQGCHQIEPHEIPALWDTPAYADKVEKLRDQFLPPTLVGVGARLRPEWMAKFLRDPSLGGGRAKSASVRAHLAVRMPTFDFSEDEIQKLVLFFQALAKQPTVYQPPEMKPLSPEEKKAADAIWKSANCMQCHVIDGMAFTSETKAPNLTYASARLRPEWAARWISKPEAMNPATSMTKNFGDDPGPDGKWRFMTPLPELSGITADHAELMARYIGQGLAGK